jgi:hypothetical protein
VDIDWQNVVTISKVAENSNFVPLLMENKRQFVEKVTQASEQQASNN